MWWQTDTFFPCEKLGATYVEQLKPAQTKNRVCNVESIVCAIYQKFWLQTRVLVCGLPSSEGETVAPVENRAASDQLAKNKFQNHMWRETLKDLRITLVFSLVRKDHLYFLDKIQCKSFTEQYIGIRCEPDTRAGTVKEEPQFQFLTHVFACKHGPMLVEFCPSGCVAMMYFHTATSNRQGTGI